MRRRALTLLEVVIGIALLAMLLGALFLFFADLVSTRESAVRIQERDAGISAAFELLEESLIAAMASHPQHGPGLRGDERSIELLAWTVPPLSAGAAAGRGMPERRVLRAADGVLLAWRGRADGHPAPREMARGVGFTRFRFHDGRAWRRDIDSARDGGLPRLVEVAIWFDDPRDPARIERDDDAEGMDADLPDGGAAVPDPADDSAAFSAAFSATDDPERFGDSDFGLPRPDRLRVFVIPDARLADEEIEP